MTLDTLSDAALMYQRQGKYALAEPYAAQSLAGRRHALPESPDTMAAASDLALVYISEGKFTKGETLAREVVETNRNKRPDHWRRFRGEPCWVRAWQGRKNTSEAEPWLLEGYQGWWRAESKRQWETRILDRAREWILGLYEAWGKPGRAAEWKKK